MSDLYNVLKIFFLLLFVEWIGSRFHRLCPDELRRDEQVVGAHAAPGTLTW